MAPVMRAITLTERNMALASSLGQTAAHIKGNLTKTISMEKVFISGLMDVNSKVTGKIIRWRDKASSHGLTIENMLETMLTIKKKAMVYSTGLTEESTKESGKTVNKTVLESILQLQEKQRKVVGLKAKE